jgi:hypothetical protein
MATEVGRHDGKAKFLKRQGEGLHRLVVALEIVHENHGRRRRGILGDGVVPGLELDAVGGLQCQFLGGRMVRRGRDVLGAGGGFPRRVRGTRLSRLISNHRCCRGLSRIDGRCGGKKQR